ncbi:MAG: hypothetical protein JWN39_3146 [Ilumatobacteraceae bacterium]|nr:hypothetical protein [Ilumatobacteraceae bacterium]
MPMSFEDKCAAWYSAISTQRRAEARAVVGPIPDWMVESLQEAGIAVIAADVTDGQHEPSCLMPTAVSDHLARRPV